MSPVHPLHISVALLTWALISCLPSSSTLTSHPPPPASCSIHIPGCNLGLLSTLDAGERLRKSLRRGGGNGLAGHSTMTYYSIHGDLPFHISSSPESRIHRVSEGSVLRKRWPWARLQWGVMWLRGSDLSYLPCQALRGSNDIMNKKLPHKTSQTSKGLFLLGNTIWTPNGLLDIVMNKNSFIFLPGGPLPSSKNITSFLQVG